MADYWIADWSFSLKLRNPTGNRFYGRCLFRGDCFPGERRAVLLKDTRLLGLQSGTSANQAL